MIAEGTREATSRRPTRAETVMRKAADFEAVSRAGKRVTSRNFVVRAGPNGSAHARLGIIAGRKAARRAVDRNRARRLIREIFVQAAERIGPHDVTVQLRSDLREALNENIRDELQGAFDALARRLQSHRGPADPS